MSVESVTWESQLLEKVPVPLVLVSVAVVAVTVLMHRSGMFNFGGTKSSKSDWSKELQEFGKKEETGPLKDIWEERKKNGTFDDGSGAGVNTRKTDASGRPFGSSYYYAHNSDRTGGYKDGLKMEDFTMNGPRLLSKGGSAVDAGVSQQQIDSDHGEARRSKSPVNSTRVPTAIPITKYLWDDPGDAKGIGTIRIDSLPSAQGGDLKPWKDAGVKDIKAELINNTEGLSVTVKVADDTTYRLYIPRLYGSTASVKKVDKGKRLLIRIFKVVDENNKADSTKAWPHPYSKVK